MNFIRFLAIGAALASTLWAQNPFPTRLSSADVIRLREGLGKLQGSHLLPAPKVGIVVITTVNGKLVDVGPPASRVIQDDLRAQLAAQGIEVLSDEIVTKGLLTVRQSLERRGDVEIASRAAEMLAESGKADIVLLVELILATDGTAIRQFRAYDVRSAPVRLLAAESNRALPVVPPTDKEQQAWWLRHQQQGTTSMLMQFAQATANLAPYVPTYRLQVLGISTRDYERWNHALRQVKQPGLEIVRVPMESGRDKADITPLWVKFPGDWYDLKSILNSSAEEVLNCSLREIGNSGVQDVIVALRSMQEPGIFRYAAKDAASPAEKVGTLLSPDRRPTVAILLGNDLDAPRAALLDERKPMPKLKLNDETTVRLLGRYFSAAGFEVKDAAAIRRQLDEQLARAGLTRDLPGMRDALRRSKTTDYLVLVRMDDVTQDLALTVLNARGDQVAFTNFPDLRHELYGDDVDVRDPSSLLRYLSAGLLAQLHDQAGDAGSRSIEVVVRNSRDAQQVMNIFNAFSAIPGVRSVDDIKIDQPIASFIVNTNIHLSMLVNLAADLAYNHKLGAKGVVEVVNEQQLILNVAPEWMTEVDSPELVKKVEELQRSDTRKPASLVEAMRLASDSVWIVGLEFADGRFAGQGTAWTVRRDFLATNYHVLIAMVGAAHKMGNSQGKIRFVARNGPNLERKIVLDMDRSGGHRAFVEFIKSYSECGIGSVGIYDVALLATSMDAGRPLPLASREELAALQPLDEIGYVGFPQEDRVGSGHSQQKVVGALSALTTAFLQDTKDYAHRHIIHYTLPVRGGASGSPLFGPTGNVIGLVSAADFIHAPTGANSKVTSRFPVGFSYAQRVDMLVDLLESGDSTRNVDALKRDWEKEFKEVNERLKGR